MKPILLVDKSFIQSLSSKEADTLKFHFYILFTPILLQEMITDIEKYKENVGEAVDKLKNLADKIGGAGQLSITDARMLFHANLDGCCFGTKAGIPIFNPKQVKAPDGSSGFVIEESFEAELIRKWQNKEISEEDIKASQNHYRGFQEYYSGNHHKKLADEYPQNKRFDHLEDLVEYIDSIALEAKTAPLCIKSVSRMTRTPQQLIDNAMRDWEEKGKAYFQSAFPYAFYFTRVFILYSLGLTNGLIPASKHSNAVNDIQYFLYLPFCDAFCSGDSFHRENFKFFQRPEQIFIWGQDLKKDLIEITAFFDNLSQEDRINYSRERGFYPPPIPNSISAKLWLETFGPCERERFGNRVVDMSEEDKKKEVDFLKNLITGSKY